MSSPPLPNQISSQPDHMRAGAIGTMNRHPTTKTTNQPHQCQVLEEDEEEEGE